MTPTTRRNEVVQPVEGSGPEPAEHGSGGAGNLLLELRGGGGSGENSPGDATPPRKRRRLHTQTLVLALVLAASVASLYTMRRQGMGAGINFAPIKNIDYKTDQLKPEQVREQQRIMAELARTVTPESFRDEPLRKNPFKLDTPANIAKAPGTGEVQLDTAAQEKAKRDQMISEQFRQLNLNGVMQGPVPLARINGKTVRAGDVIDGLFLVVEIHERTVDLMVDEKIYTLQMSDTAAPGGGRRPPAPNMPHQPVRR